MKKLLSLVLITLGLVALATSLSKNALAQEEQFAPAKFYIARITEIVEEGEKVVAEDYSEAYQKVKAKILQGDQRGTELEIDHGSLFSLQDSQKVKKGELVVITQAQADLYYISDNFRLLPIALVFLAVLVCLYLLSKTEMLGLVASMIVTLGVITNFTIPQIIMGKNPLAVSLATVLGASVLIVYLGYGMGKKMNRALLGSVTTFIVAGLIAFGLIKLASISGSGSEEAIFLQTGLLDANGLKGLLLAGMLTGLLGVVNYLAVNQVEVVEELRGKLAKTKKMKLIREAIKVGGKKLISLVTIIFFAYLGVSINLLMLFGINQQVPFWVTLNSEFLTEETIRILVALSAIILTVPLTTVVAVQLKGESLKGRKKA